MSIQRHNLDRKILKADPALFRKRNLKCIICGLFLAHHFNFIDNILLGTKFKNFFMKYFYMLLLL